MAARVGHDPSILVDHPIKMQLLALGIGSAASPFVSGQNASTRVATALGPVALVQMLRHLELKKIQKKYDKEKRKRLAELDQEELFDTGALGFGGSSRLGAVNAYETMRARKYKGFGSLAEAGDAIQLASNAISPALGLGVIPLVSGIDNREADRMLKRAEFTDQRNSPSIPLYLAAAALSAAGMNAAGRWAHRENSNTPELGTGKWADTVRDMGGGNPLLLSTEGVGNAFFYKPRSPQEAEQFLRATGHLSQAPMGSIIATNNANRKRLERFGAIIADSTAGAPTIAHEAGHAKIEETPGILRALQRHVYPHTRWLSPLAGAGSMAAGLASGGAGKGALLGTGIGAITGLGMLGPETGASYYALKHLKGLGDGSLSAEGRKDLISALSTYLAGTVLPSTLAGAAGGWISGRRKRREEEEDEEQEKEASSPERQQLLDAGECCGADCGACPYIPRHRKGATKVANLAKDAASKHSATQQAKASSDEENEADDENEKQKGLDGKACWKGYKLVGTKMKGGKRVDDCVKVADSEQEKSAVITGITKLKSIFTPSASPSMLQRVEFPALTGLKKFDAKELPLEEIKRRLKAAGINLYPDSRTANVGYLRNDVMPLLEINSLLGEAAKRHNFSTLDAGMIINPNIAHQANTGAGARVAARLGFDRYKGSAFPTLSVKGPAYSEALAKYKKEIENLEAGNFQNGFTDELRSLRQQWLKKGDKFLNDSGFSTPEQTSEYLYNVAAMRGEHAETIRNVMRQGTGVKPTAPGIRHYADPSKKKESYFDFPNLLQKTAAYVGNFSKAAVLGGQVLKKKLTA
jgi:hypothetical protein